MKRAWHYKRRARFAEDEKRQHRPQVAFTCERKNAYRSERVARQAADRAQEDVLKRGRVVTISVYDCPYCKQFHLTSARNRR